MLMRVRTPPCLAMSRHKWLPSRAREVRLSMVARSDDSGLDVFKDSTLSCNKMKKLECKKVTQQFKPSFWQAID